MNSKYIGKVIARLREKHKLSTTQLARKSGVSQSSISQYENGNRNPSDENIEKIASALHTTVEELVKQAELLSKENPHLLDETELTNEKRRAIERIYRFSDSVIQVNNDILISVNIRVHDLANIVEYNSRHSSAVRSRGFMSFEKDTTSLIAHLTEKVVNDFINENSEEILYRFEHELKQLNMDVYTMLEEIRKRNMGNN